MRTSVEVSAGREEDCAQLIKSNVHSEAGSARDGWSGGRRRRRKRCLKTSFASDVPLITFQSCRPSIKADLSSEKRDCRIHAERPFRRKRCDNSWFYSIQSIENWGDSGSRWSYWWLGESASTTFSVSSSGKFMSRRRVENGSRCPLDDYTLMCDITQPFHYYDFINAIRFVKVHSGHLATTQATAKPYS